MKLKGVVIAVMLLLVTVPAYAAVPTLNLGSVSGMSGQLVTIPVTLTTNGANIAALGLDIAYNPNLLTPQGLPPVTPATAARYPAEIGPAGAAASKSVVQSQLTAVYRVGVLDLGSAGVIGSGVVVNMTFAVAANASGPVTVTITPTASDSTGLAVAITGSGSVITVTPSSWTLSVVTAGTGSGSVNSSPSGIACVTGSSVGCSAGYTGGSIVTLTPTASSNSAFGGWTGACTGLGVCQVTMDAVKSGTASFSANPATVRIDSQTAVPYYNLGGTLDTITTAQTVRAKNQTFVENVVMTSPAVILLKGGYTDGAFGVRTTTSFTVLDGSLKIRKGTLKVERLLVR